MSRDYITLTQAAKLVPGRPNTSTLWRWCRTGVVARSGEHVRLKHYRVGRRLFTTAEALDDFFAATSSADIEHFDVRKRRGRTTQRPAAIDCERQRQLREARDELESEGL